MLALSAMDELVAPGSIWSRPCRVYHTGLPRSPCGRSATAFKSGLGCRVKDAEARARSHALLEELVAVGAAMPRPAVNAPAKSDSSLCPIFESEFSSPRPYRIRNFIPPQRVRPAVTTFRLATNHPRPPPQRGVIGQAHHLAPVHSVKQGSVTTS